MPRGGRRSNPGGRPKLPEADRRIPRSVGLTVAEYKRWTAALYPGETFAEFVREAGDRLADERRKESL